MVFYFIVKRTILRDGHVCTGGNIFLPTGFLTSFDSSGKHTELFKLKRPCYLFQVFNFLVEEIISNGDLFVSWAVLFFNNFRLFFKELECMNRVHINQKVTVTAVSFNRQLQTAPRRMEYNGKTYTFPEPGLHYEVRQGENFVRLFDVSDERATYRLRCDGDQRDWTLVTITNHT